MPEPTDQVLLIEDNPGDADFVRDQLAQEYVDADVTCVDRLSAGLEHLVRKGPGLVLLDLNLPDSHGAETYRRLLDHAPNVPVVILSGQQDEELAIRAVHQGVQDYLVKGAFDSKQLARAMRYAKERQALLTSLQISRQQQLQFKDQFLSHISHELRTPLTSVHQFVTILLDNLAGPLLPEQREYLEIVLKGVNQLRAMIGDLLEATRAENSKLRLVPRCLSLHDLINESVLMLRNNAATLSIRLRVEVERHLPFVFADPDRVSQILINLLDNALKFTPPDGSVTIRGHTVAADPEFAYISVTDTGAGISPEAKPLIFERMYQEDSSIDRSKKGLGLGLYITRELVRLHGGRIWVESEPGQGSTFSFTLPLFSLPKLLLPLITESGHLREAVSLIDVALAPLPTDSARQNWRDTQRHGLELLQKCIQPTKDVVLPSRGGSGEGETFFIVASTSPQGAQVLAKRIADQLKLSGPLKANSSWKISVRLVPLPAHQDSVERLVKTVAEQITSMIRLTIQQNKHSGAAPAG